MKCFTFCILFSLNIMFSDSIDPITAAGGIGALFLGFSHLFDSFYGSEYCSDKWINLDINRLQSSLQKNVFGQHLMQDIVIRTLKAHMKEEPKKALVLSFHGPSGTGKNLVSSFISKNLFKEDVRSHYFHLYIGSRDFPHSELKDRYMQQLRDDVEKATRLCNRNLFVFDEVDKMVPGVLDALSPYIDFYESVKGVDYRKNIFIFLSNKGATNITKVALKFLDEGKSRERITLKDIESSVVSGAFHEIGGLHNSEIVKRDRIDTYVPFLPLEKKHIKDCIHAELKAQKWMATQDMVDKIAEQFEYIPKDKEVFARSGCRKVNKMVELFVDDFNFNGINVLRTHI